MMSQPSAEYPLARTFISSARLNLQHYNTTQSQGFLVHPSVQINDIKKPIIADIGTGTGIWLLDLSEHLRNDEAQYWGFDVNLAQTPAKEWLPENVHMRHWDVFEDVPEEFIGAFAFICVVQNGDPRPIISNLLRMLKPGGYIQWTEMDFESLHIESTVPSESLPGTQKLLQVAKSPNPKWPESLQKWPKDLTNIFSTSGMTSVVEHRFRRRPWQRAFYHDVTLLAMSEMASKSPDPAATQDIINQAAQEFAQNKRGVDIPFESITVVGRKPL